MSFLIGDIWIKCHVFGDKDPFFHSSFIFYTFTIRLFFKINIDYRSIAIYLHFKGLSAKDIKDEINEVFPQNDFSYQQITYCIRQLAFTHDKEMVRKKETGDTQKQRTELIKKTLKDFPFSSLKQISQRTNIPKTSVYRILTNDLGYVLKSLKWIPHQLTSSQKVSRIDMSKKLLTILNESQQMNYINIITGDESWFYLTTDYETQWLPPGEKPMKREKK